MTDYRSLRDAEEKAEVMFSDYIREAEQDEERRELAREWGDRILFWVLVTVGVVAAAELVLRLGFGVRTIL